MAQSKSFFGLRKGSTKSLTFQVLNGKQITKDRVYNVKNPQTLAQMQQRALMATAVTAYSNMKAICDHSFEGIEVGSKTMGEFIKNNLVKLSAEMPGINVTDYKSGTFVNNKYMVSKGTLNSFNSTVEGNDLRFDTGIAVSDPDDIKWKDIASKLGIKQDGMLTFVVIFESLCYWLRIKFTKEMLETAPTIGSTGIVGELSKIGAVEGNSIELSDIVLLNRSGSGNYFFEIKLNEGDSAAAIISEKSGNVWKRSTAYLNGNFKFFYEAGFSTYPINTTLLLNGAKMSTNVL